MALLKSLLYDLMEDEYKEMRTPAQPLQLQPGLTKITHPTHCHGNNFLNFQRGSNRFLEGMDRS